MYHALFGKGLSINAKGDKYKGEFKDSLYNGKGILTTDVYTYDG